MDERNRFSAGDVARESKILSHDHLHPPLPSEPLRDLTGRIELSADTFRERSHHTFYLSDQRPFWSVTHHSNARHPGRAETAERRRTCGRGCTNSEKTTNRIKTKMI